MFPREKSGSRPDGLPRAPAKLKKSKLHFVDGLGGLPRSPRGLPSASQVVPKTSPGASEASRELPRNFQKSKLLSEAERLRRETEREVERRVQERRQREAEERQRRETELQRQREEEIRQRARVTLQAQHEQQVHGEEDAIDFKPCMPRTWPQLSATQVKKKDALPKRLRSQRTMRKRAEDRGDPTETSNANIDAILREAWCLHRRARSGGTD